MSRNYNYEPKIYYISKNELITKDGVLTTTDKVLNNLLKDSDFIFIKGEFELYQYDKNLGLINPDTTI